MYICHQHTSNIVLTTAFSCLGGYKCCKVQRFYKAFMLGLECYVYDAR